MASSVRLLANSRPRRALRRIRELKSTRCAHLWQYKRRVETIFREWPARERDVRRCLAFLGGGDVAVVCVVGNRRSNKISAVGGRRHPSKGLQVRRKVTTSTSSETLLGKGFGGNEFVRESKGFCKNSSDPLFRSRHFRQARSFVRRIAVLRASLSRPLLRQRNGLHKGLHSAHCSHMHSGQAGPFIAGSWRSCPAL